MSNRMDLAIVIPAYKARFLSKTLESICSQTSQEFNLYIGDDCSPEPVADIVREFQLRRPITYVRFPENLGGRSLTDQWERCVALTQEPWVWLFSDDDRMQPTCVEAFNRHVRGNARPCDVYRFNTLFIDAAGATTALNPPHPEWESWKTFCYFLLRRLRVSTTQETVFARAAYDRCGGFVSFPLAWGSDHASLIKFGARTGIGRINGPHVEFRQSGLNISSAKSRAMDSIKIQATMGFVAWLLATLREYPDPHFLLSDSIFDEATSDWFKSHLQSIRMLFRPADYIQIARFMNRTWHTSMSSNLGRLVKMNLSSLPQIVRRRAA